MTTLDQITQALGAEEALGPLADALDTSDSDTESLLGAGIPALLSRLGQLTAKEDSAAALHGLTSDDGGSLFDNLEAFLNPGTKSELASRLVGAIFGSRRGAVEKDLSASTGLALPSITRFLPVLAPVALSLLGKFGSDESADAAGLAAMLADESGASADPVDDQDQAGFIAGVASLQDGGGLGALVPNAGAARGDDDDDGYERSGLGWLVPTFAVVSLLIVGLVLWQFDNSAAGAGELSPLAVEGQAIAGTYACSVCHGEAGEGGIGPSWQGLYLSEVELEDNVSVVADDEYLLRSITDPAAEIVAGFTTKMPASKLNDEQLAALVAYLKEL